MQVGFQMNMSHIAVPQCIKTDCMVDISISIVIAPEKTNALLKKVSTGNIYQVHIMF